VETYPNDVAIYFMQNPLGFHKQAMPAAKATLAAHRQGKFWEMHDKCFANSKALTPANFTTWATEIGLDLAKFKTDMADKAMEKEILRQQAAMVALGARGTPGFFVNGEQVKGAQPFPQFKKVIDKQIAAVDAEIAKGLSRMDAMVANSRASHAAGDNFVKWALHGEQAPKAAPPKSKQRPIADKTVWKAVVSDEDAFKGGKDAYVTMVEFSEFQCPFCAKINPSVKQIMDTYGEDVKVVFKHNPLPFHKDAPLAAEASMAAQAQGKFWEYHDVLFANMKALKRENLEAYAEQLNLDMSKFKAALDNGTYKSRLKADMDAAQKVQARGTPNSFINGRQVSGARPFADFKKIIDEELAKAKKMEERGIAKADIYANIIKSGKEFKPLADKVSPMSHNDATIYGKPDAKIKIYEFSDFQ